MNLRQLEAFRAVMKCGSITAAAQALGISQPSVSRLVTDLERTVGFPLFTRLGRGLVATVEAQRFVEAVDSTFIGLGRLTEIAATIRATTGTGITLGVIPAFAQAVVPEAVRDLRIARPETHLTVYMRNTPAIVDAVRVQQFDLGVVGRAPPYPGVEVLFHTSVPYVCLLPAEHPAAGEGGRLDLRRLCETDTFVTFGGIYPDEMLEIDHALSARLRERSRLSAANTPVAAALVRATGALAIVDPFSAGVAERLGGVVSRPIRQRLKYNIAIVTRGRDTLPLPGRELADMLAARFAASAA